MEENTNIQYLNKYPKIEKYFKKAAKRIQEGELEEASVHLRKCSEGILIEIARGTQWYKNRVAERKKPSNDEMIKYLNLLNIIDEKQTDLFNTIRKLGNRNAHYDNNHIQNDFLDLETLKNLFVRLNKELPSLMSNLGIGGASRLQFINKTSKDTVKSVKSNTDVVSLRRKYQNEVRDYINDPNSYKNNSSSFSEYFDTSSKPISYNRNKPMLVIKFLLSLLLTFVLIITIANDKLHILENIHSSVGERVNILVNKYKLDEPNIDSSEAIRKEMFTSFFSFITNIKDGKFDEFFK